MTTEPIQQATPVLRANGGRQPLLWAAVSFAAGEVMAFYFWRPTLWWLLSALAFLAFALFFVLRRAWAARLLSLAALFLSGAFVLMVRAPENLETTALRPFVNGDEVTVTAHVTKEGNAQPEGRNESRQSVDVETELLETDSATAIIKAGLRVNFYSKEVDSTEPAVSELLPLFRYGERLRFRAKLNFPRNFGNPGAFDYRGYLAQQGIAALGSAKTSSIEYLPGFVGARTELWRTRIHRSLIEKIHSLWLPSQAALIDAMVIGEDAFINPATRADFQRSGTYHILVVSGMNVGILAVAVFWLFRRLRISELASSSFTVLLSVAYAFLTDVGAPIWRATLMLALYLAVRLVYRDRGMLNALGAAALGLLLFDPYALFGASFQLTFLSVLLIAAVGVPVLERTIQPYRKGLWYLNSTAYDQALPPRVAQFRLDLRLIAGRLQRFVGHWISLRFLGGMANVVLATGEILVVSALMQVGLALPMAYYFHRATVVGLPANMLVVPLTGVLMPAAILAVAAAYVSPMLAVAPAWIAGLALRGITGTVQWLGSWRVSDARVATPELIVMFAGSAALIFAMLAARRHRLVACAGMAALLTAAFWINLVPPQARRIPNVLEVTSIDVGQGDSILLVLPDGKTVLVDSGGLPHWMHSEFDIGENVVSPYLWQRRIQRLDTVVVTHAHADHMGGMGAILENFRPKELWLGVDSPSADLDRLLAQARQLGVTVRLHKAGDSMRIGEIGVRVLAPEPDPQSRTWKPNDDCLVMKVVYRNTSVLLEGDAEPQVERRIAGEHPEADLLKVAHHGSAGSTIPALLAAVKPHYAVISVGARNVYGHPRRETLGRLAQAAVRTYRTDLNGAISFYLDGNQVTASVEALR